MKINMKIIMALILIMSVFNLAYANDTDSDNIGPGIGLDASTYDFSNVVSNIYGATSNGISGYYESMANTYSVAPTYTENTIENPIDNYNDVDMSPTSNYQFAEYSLHSINDGGPGTGVKTNELGSSMLYNDGGPGMKINVDYSTNDAPNTTTNTANPENYYNIIANGGPTSGEVISDKKNK